MFYLNGDAISWKSLKQEIVANSTKEIEYIATSDATKKAIWIKKFIIKPCIVLSIANPVDLYYDNNGAITQAKEPRSHRQFKHIIQCFHLICEIIDKKDVKICRVPTDNNIANTLTNL